MVLARDVQPKSYIWAVEHACLFNISHVFLDGCSILKTHWVFQVCSSRLHSEVDNFRNAINVVSLERGPDPHCEHFF